MERLLGLERRLLGLVFVLAVGTLCLDIGLRQDLSQLERVLHDGTLARRSAQAGGAASRSTVILVDDETLQRLGERWPLARNTWADAVEKIANYGPTAILIDAWFEVPAPTGPSELAQDMADTVRHGPLGSTAEGGALAEDLDLLSAALDADQQFARSLAQAGAVVLGFGCVREADTHRFGSEASQRPQPLDEADLSGSDYLHCPRVVGNMSTLRVSAAGEGSLAVHEDSDGVVRRYSYLTRHGDEAYSSLALAALQVSDPDRFRNVLDHLQQRDGGRPLLGFRPVERFTTVRLSDVVQAQPGDPELKKALAGRYVFIGVSALGTEDLVNLPGQARVPGVFTHASALTDALEDQTISVRSVESRAYSLGALVLFGLVVILTWRRSNTFHVIFHGVGAALLWFVLVDLAMAHGLSLAVDGLLLALSLWLLAKVLLQLAHGAMDRRRARDIRGAFSHYVAPEVVAELIEHPDRLQLGGERREITAFFSDIAGFTSMAEQMDPQQLVSVLNQCLGRMSSIIVEEGGIIDKYIGDAIVAIFGAPQPHEDHAERAGRAAWRCQRAMETLREELVAQGLPMLSIRIGLNTGEAIVGNMGSTGRFDYTMIGDMVNLAARLESTNKMYGTEILLGPETGRRLSAHFDVREIDAVRVKGKSQAVTVYQLLGTSVDASQRSHERFAEALAAYRRRDWDRAETILAEPEYADDPVAIQLRDRVRSVRDQALPEDWNGVFEMTHK